jgi:hypothetical protein
VIGLGIGLAVLQSIQATLESLGIAVLAWIGSLIGVFGMFNSYFKDRREEKKTPKLALGEPYRRQDNSYFVDVALKSWSETPIVFFILISCYREQASRCGNQLRL